MSKQRYFFRRAVHSLITLWVLMTILFCLFRLLPGDPVAAVSSPEMSAEVKRDLIERFELDKPLYVQYVGFFRGTLRGDLGISFAYQRPVFGIVLARASNTLILIIVVFIVSYSLGFLIGVISAWKRGSRIDNVLLLFALGFRSAPVLWTGMMALYLLSYLWHVFPVGGIRSPGSVSTNFFEHFFNLDFLHHLFLPVVVSSLYFMGFPALLTRSAMHEVMDEDFIELARAKGLKEVAVMFKHAARNAILPAVTAAAVFIGWAFGGILTVEYVFSWPGLGTEMVYAVGYRDYPLAQGCFIFIGLLIIAANLVADFIYGYLDPRIVYQ